MKKIQTKVVGFDMNLEPYSDRVIVKKVVIETRTSGGIILSENEDEDNRDLAWGRVLSVGEGKQLDNSGPLPMKTKVGDLVAFNERMPTRLHYKGEYIFILRETDIMLRNNDRDIIEKEFESYSSFNKSAKPLV